MDIVCLVYGYSMFNIWTKLQRIAQQAKHIHKEYSSVETKLIQLREKLQNIQEKMICDLFNQHLIEEEREILKLIEKWEEVHEKILRQQSRIVWIQQGDRNSKYFYTVLKARKARNQIALIYN